MPAALTSLEQQILDYMVRYLRANTYQPSIREIGEEFGIRSTKTVSEHLRALADKGYLKRDPSRSRGVRILGVDLNPQTLSIPCYPDLPDGSSGFDSDGVETYLSVDRRLGGARGCYFVRARGDAFAGVGIEEGSLFLVEPVGDHGPETGDLLVVRMEGSPRLVRVESVSGEEVQLQVARAGSSLRAGVEVGELSVLGRVTALYRRFDGAPVASSPVTH